MTCNGAMSRKCRGDEARPYRSGIWMCDICAEVGKAHGMALDLLPAWMARALPVKDYTEASR